MKRMIRKILNFLHLDLTKNLKYDRFTKNIIESVIHPESNCIDVGSHKGEILDLIIEHAPNGKHFAFEPIPHLYESLKRNYSKVCIYPYALSNTESQMEFNYVKNAPAYSGLKERKYASSNPYIQKIKVEVRRLDDIIPYDFKIDFLKIDVEGGEYGVLLGAKNILLNSKPVVLFEFGLGASDFYNIKPIDLYSYLESLNYQIFTLNNYLHKNEPLSLQKLEDVYISNEEYYFVAESKTKNK